jgi:hypothetical protein
MTLDKDDHDKRRPRRPSWTRIGPRRHRTTATDATVIATAAPTANQGLTLVRFPAQRKHILLDRDASRGCLGGVREVSGGVKDYQGVFRVYFVSETAQVELRSGRV